MPPTQDTNSTSSRLASTVIIWILLIGAMLALSLFMGKYLEQNVIFIPILFTVAGLILSGFLWNWGQLPHAASQDVAAEMLKRNRLTMALRDLSDTELQRLRQRLSSGDLDDDQLARLLDESDISKAKRASSN